MSEGNQITGAHSRSANGGRWYDPNRMTMGLFGIVGFFIIGWGSWVFVMSRASEVKNVEQDQKIQAIEKAFERFETKLDRVLEKSGK